MKAEFIPRNANPILYLHVKTESMGTLPAFVLMSRENYGLVICVDGSDEFDQLSLAEIGEIIVAPIVQYMPKFVSAYKEYVTEDGIYFPEFQMKRAFDYAILDASKIQLISTVKLPPGTLTENTRYIFAAQENVRLDEFVLTKNMLN